MRHVRACLLLASSLAAGCGDLEPDPVPPEVQALVHDLVDGTDYDARMAAHEKLPRYGEVVVAPLARALDREDVDDAVGAWIAETLGTLGAAATDAAPALGRRLRRGGDCSATTSWALGRMGAAGLPELVAAMASAHAKTRIWASDALADGAGSLGAEAEAARGVLIAALDDPIAEVRQNGVRGLAGLGTPSVSVGAALVARIGDADESVALAALEAVERLGLWSDAARRQVAALLETTGEDLEFARDAARRLLREADRR